MRPIPRPLPRREGVPAVEMTLHGLVSALGGEGFAPSPLGEGWGEVIK
jgi:hypothetical protein